MAAKPNQYLNRELSWLAFNQRVLEEAQDPTLPLLERLKFIAIFGNNLDEFFMVRVGSLQALTVRGDETLDPAGLTPAQQLQEISRLAHELVDRQYACLRQDLEPKLEQAGIRRLTTPQLAPAQIQYLDDLFEHELFPVLTPMAVEGEEDFPLLPGLSVNLCVRLKPGKGTRRMTADEVEKGSARFVIVPLPRALARFITLPADQGYQYIPLEDVVSARLSRFFPGETVEEAVPFRITRNADMAIREDQAGDLLRGMQEILSERKQSECIRLEMAQGASDRVGRFLKQALDIRQDRDVYTLAGPLDATAFFRLARMQGFAEHKIAKWLPQEPPELRPGESIFSTLARQDLLLYHPYESFNAVVRLVEEAADDPQVLAIKQILYRTSEESPLIAALTRAAERDKQVTVLVELKARFDEARNIEWAQALELAGVQVIYGLRGLKAHAKICVVVRREPAGIRRYVHFGTGNYNEKTARLYSDLSYMTCHTEYGMDASAFFNSITGLSRPAAYLHLETAPLTLRARLLELIENEIERRRQGQEARIIAKINSLVDPQIIDALYEASRAGVPVELNVRGICCLLPGVPGMSDNISVISILDRFLEHARIFCFHNGGKPQVFLSSADWMPRNFDRRVELLVQVEDRAARQRLIHILKTSLADNVQARRLQADGVYLRLTPKNRKPVRSQELFYRETCAAAEQAARQREKVFVPQTAQGK